MQVDLLHHLPGQTAGPEHENVTEVVAAPAQRVEDLLEEHPRERDSQEAEAGEERERAPGVAGVADEVGGRDQQETRDQRGLEDPEDLVQRSPVPLGPVEAHGAHREGPDDQRQGGDDERLFRQRQIRVGPGARGPEAQGIGARESSAHQEHVEKDPQSREELVVPLEHRWLP